MNWTIIFQYLLPQVILSRFVAKIANCRIAWFKNLVITQYCKFYQIEMAEMQEPDPTKYPTFNDFFIRELKPGARVVATEPGTIVAPVDGCLKQFGTLQSNLLIVAKGRGFTVEQLLADAAAATLLSAGNFALWYLSPADYHRIHMPVAGKLVKMRYIPGKLFSVSPKVVAEIPELFARNERVVLEFATSLGPLFLVLVGAIIVRSIVTKWAGVVAPNNFQTIQTWDYATENLEFAQGAELAHFKLGSTAILLLPPGVASWEPGLQEDCRVKMGQKVGQVLESQG